MIVPYLQGGLGNQLFQIANAYALSKRYNCLFGINYTLSTCPNQGNTAEKYQNTLYQKLPITNNKPDNIYQEPSFKYNAIPKTNNVLLMGYFQSSRYFEDCKNDIRQLFTFPSCVKNKVDNFLSEVHKPIIGVHIRRGDYIKPNFIKYHGILTSEYYSIAAKMFQDHKAIICTDDWGSVQKEMSFSKAKYSPFTDELEDLYLLSQCDSLIICNSSFSWWGAFLGKNKQKVIAPKKWFVENKEHDIYEKDWIIL